MAKHNRKKHRNDNRKEARRRAELERQVKAHEERQRQRKLKEETKSYREKIVTFDQTDDFDKIKVADTDTIYGAFFRSESGNLWRTQGALFAVGEDENPRTCFAAIYLEILAQANVTSGVVYVSFDGYDSAKAARKKTLEKNFSRNIDKLVEHTTYDYYYEIPAWIVERLGDDAIVMVGDAA